MTLPVETWAEQVRAGDVRAISRAITAIENHQAGGGSAVAAAFSAYGASLSHWSDWRAGDGEEHAGRSAGELITENIRKQVGVIAVDPTSPYSGGAILGDRIRMQGHAGTTGRSFDRWRRAGLWAGWRERRRKSRWSWMPPGKRRVLIETVGVGQDEIDIVRLADCVLVVLVPGMGDDIQNMKAGLMEIGDIFVLNKADREGADRLEQQLLAMLSLVMPREGWHPPMVRTVASESKGIEALAETIGKFRKHFEASGERRGNMLSIGSGDFWD